MSYMNKIKVKYSQLSEDLHLSCRVRTAASVGCSLTWNIHHLLYYTHFPSLTYTKALSP